MKRILLAVAALLVIGAAAHSMVSIKKAGGPREISATTGATSAAGTETPAEAATGATSSESATEATTGATTTEQ